MKQLQPVPVYNLLVTRANQLNAIVNSTSFVNHRIRTPPAPSQFSASSRLDRGDIQQNPVPNAECFSMSLLVVPLLVSVMSLL